VKRLYVEKPRERVLTEEEIRTLWPLFDRLQPAVSAAWRLILLTAQRPGEVLSMRWRDLERDSRGWWWNLPAELTKTHRAHRVPLSPQALAVVEALRPLSGTTEWVFASRAEGKRLTWLSHSSARLREWSGLEHFTPHDLRVLGRVHDHRRLVEVAVPVARVATGRDLGAGRAGPVNHAANARELLGRHDRITEAIELPGVPLEPEQRDLGENPLARPAVAMRGEHAGIGEDFACGFGHDIPSCYKLAWFDT